MTKVRTALCRSAAVALLALVALTGGSGCGGGGGLGGGLLGGLGGGLGGGLLGGGGGPLGLIIGILSNIKIINPLDTEFQAPATAQARSGAIFDQPLGRPIVGTAIHSLDAPGGTGAAGPDGMIYYTERTSGRVRQFNLATLTVNPNPVIDLNVNNAGTRGLKGVCFSPDGGRMFVTYCASATAGDSLEEPEGLELRVSVFPFAGGAVAGPEMILRTSACRDPAFPSAINSIGPCLIGPDSRLYFSCGDLDSRLLAQNAFTSDFAGKMHRIDQDGAIPLDNPFGPEITTWALGLRNPAAFTFDSENGDFWCVDNGNLISDEINRGTPGSNYGWPLIQGLDNTDPEGILTGSLFGLYTQPVVDYGQEQVDPMGIVMIRNGNYGDDIVGNLFVAKSFEQGSVSRWFLGGLIVVRGELFQTALESGTINNMFFGPDGMVYVLTNVHLYRVEPA